MHFMNQFDIIHLLILLDLNVLILKVLFMQKTYILALFSPIMIMSALLMEFKPFIYNTNITMTEFKYTSCFLFLIFTFVLRYSFSSFSAFTWIHLILFKHGIFFVTISLVTIFLFFLFLPLLQALQSAFFKNTFAKFQINVVISIKD